MLNICDLCWNQIVIKEQAGKNKVEISMLTDRSKLVTDAVIIDVKFKLVNVPFPC
jgi:hypothetical protein